MTSIREIFTTFGPEYLQRYATRMPKTHRKVIDAIIALSHGSLRYCVFPVRQLRRAAKTSFAPAVTATAPPVSTLKPSSGPKNRSFANSQAIIS